MQIKSVTIKGFKSFADKLKLQFDRGMIAIVGPNGSGKSNIVDAILWVLGEQSARLLRGDSMEDVIFAGSSVHKALGIAEVSLVLDNSDKTLPVEFSEIHIARRLFRSGESQYMLNGKQSKLNDIKELLSEAALGKGIYSIISQGRIDEVLSSKPEDRRLFVDEAAGVLKHRSRRQKTERKLKDIEEKMLRANDIYLEIKRQIGPLEKQAEDANRYSQASERLKSLETELIARKIVKFKKEWDDIGVKESTFLEEIKQVKKELDQTIDSANEATAQTLKLRMEESEVSRLREQALVMNSKFGSLIQRIDQTINNHREKISSLENELKEMDSANLQFDLFDEEYLSKLNDHLADVSQQILAKKDVLALENKAAQDLRDQRSQLEKKIQEVYSKVQEDKVSLKSTDIAHADVTVGELKASLDKISSELQVATENISKYQQELDNIQAEYKAVSNQKRLLEKALMQAGYEYGELQQTQSKLKNDMTARTSELNTLKNILKKR